MDIEYKKTKRIDIKRWLLGGNSRLYMIILIVFLAVFSFVLNSVLSLLREENSSGPVTDANIITEVTSEAITDAEASTGGLLYENSSSYIIKINRSTNVLAVYKRVSADKIEPVKAYPCAINQDISNGETKVSGKQTWIRNEDYSYGHYASLLGNGAYINSAPYWRQSTNSLNVAAYNNIGQSTTVGSIILRAADAKWIYENCGINIPVFIYEIPDEKTEVEIEEFVKLSGSYTYDPSDR